jgi:hypothetical protein
MRDGSDAHTPAGAHTCRTRTHLPFALCGTHAAAASKSAAVFHAAGAIAKISHGPNKKDNLETSETVLAVTRQDGAA